MRTCFKHVSVLLVAAMLFTTVNIPAFAAKATKTFTNDALIECEDATLKNGAATEKDKMASGGKYVFVADGTVLKDPTTYKSPDMEFKINISDHSTYKVFVRMNITNGGNDSFHYKWDDNEWKESHPGQTWSYQWLAINTQNLTVGEHTFSITHREPMASFDALYITCDADSVPTIEEMAVATPTPMPTKKPLKIFEVGNGVAIEAEDGTIDDGLYSISDDPDASGKKIIIPKGLRGDTPPPSTITGDVEYTFTTDHFGTYSIFVREKAPGVGSESIHFAVDDGNYGSIWLPISADAWIWTKLTTKIFEEGTHKLKLCPRKSNLPIDKFIITDQIYTPSGLGEIPEDFTKVEMSKIDSTYNEPSVTPPAEHPRLLFRKGDIEKIKSNIENDVVKAASDSYRDNISKTTDGVLQPGSNGKVTVTTDKLPIITDHALNYALYGNEESGKLAISAMTNFLRSVAAASGYDATRTGGDVIFNASCVYDWCYPLMSNDDKTFFIRACEAIASGMEMGWPPREQGAVTGHGCEAQLLRDDLGFAIATYDERPDIWNFVAGRFYDEFVPAHNFANQAGWHHQGDSYGQYRHSYDTWAQLLITSMGAPAPFEDSLYDIYYGLIYMRRPDGQVLRDGDCYSDGAKMWAYWNSAGKWNLYMDSILSGNPYFLDEAYRQDMMGAGSTSQFYLIYGNEDMKSRSVYELPKSHFFNDPLAMAIARTGWEDGATSPAAVCEMKIGGYLFGNHQDFDNGHFQLYYKGILASDSGIYQGKIQAQGAYGTTTYGSVHQNAYARKSIAHNTVLVFDPNETFPKGYNDGGQNPKLAYLEPSTLQLLHDGNKDAAKSVAREMGPDTHDPAYTYIKGDMTGSYSDKIKDFKRSFMFLNLFDEEVPAALIVFDKVSSSNASFKKTWLLHGLEEPEINGNKTIYRRTYADTKNNVAYNGKLTCDTLMPTADNTAIEKIGGEGKEFFYQGTNYFGYDSCRVGDEDTGWRIEVSPKNAAETDYFLNVLQVSDNDKEYYRDVTKIDTDKVAGAVISDRVVTFSKSGENISDEVSFTVNGNGDYQYMLADMKPGTWGVSVGGQSFDAVATDEGALVSFTAPAGEVVCTYKSAGGTKEFINTPNPQLDVVSIRYNGRFIYSDVPATIINDRTLVPMRAIFECIGAKLEYDDANATATATLGDRVVKVTENNKTAYVDGNEVALDVPAMILNDRFVVPVRFISESFGATVDWDEDAKTVFVTPSNEILVSKVDQEGYAKIDKVEASLFNDENYPDKVLDLDLKTVWAAEGEQYLEFTFDKETAINNVEVILNPNNGRSAEFEILYSDDGKEWKSVKKYYGDPLGNGQSWEIFEFPQKITTKHVRYLAKGSDKSMWNGVEEMRFKIAQ